MITIRRPINFLNPPRCVSCEVTGDEFLVKHQSCQRCSFANAQIPHGFLSAPILFVGKDFNISLEDEMIFRETMSTLGIHRSDIMYIGAIGCRIKKGLTREEQLTAIERCLDWKYELLYRMPNLKYIILSGIHAYRAFYGPVERLIDHVGNVFESDVFGRTVSVIPIPSPIHLARNPELAKKVDCILTEVGAKICL